MQASLIIFLLFARTLGTILATTTNSEQQGPTPPENGTLRRSSSSSSRSEISCGESARCVRARYCAATRNDLRMDDLSPCGRRSSATMVCCPIAEAVRDTQPSSTTGTTYADTPRRTNQGIAQPNCGRSINLRPLRPSDVGAENARKRQFPWMVALTFKNGSEHESLECGAALIDSRHLLTAAHCFRSDDPLGYKARIGALDWRQGSSHDIAKIAVHPGFVKGQFYDDIAVLTLAQEVTDPQVRSICLPDDEILSIRLEGHGTTIAGWGTTNYGGEQSRTLKYVSAIPVMPNTECKERLERLVSGFRREFPRGLTRGILCAGFMEGGKDSCGGDSGGPLMLRRKGRYYAVGVVSFGYGCGKPGYPAGYTRISEYADFIRTSTQD